MREFNKDEVTVLIPCLNEQNFLGKTINFYKNAGFRKILIIDDASTDNTYKIAKDATVDIIKNKRILGFDLTTLKGIYNISTKFALIVSIPEKKLMNIVLMNLLCLESQETTRCYLLDRNQSER